MQRFCWHRCHHKINSADSCMKKVLESLNSKSQFPNAKQMPNHNLGNTLAF
jgi:hypothetical protein